MTATSKALAGAIVVTVILAAAGCLEWQANLRRQMEIAGLERQVTGLSREIAQSQGQQEAGAVELPEARAGDGEPVATDDSGLEGRVRSSLERIRNLKGKMAQSPGLQIPEMRFLTDNDWLRVSQDHPLLDSDADYRRALAEVRQLAADHVISKFSQALKDCLAASQGHLPTDVSQLAPYMDPPLEPAILDRYTMIKTGVVGETPGVGKGSMMIGGKVSSLPDPTYDTLLTIGQNGYGSGAAYDRSAVDAALRAFRAANPGQDYPEARILATYFQNQADAAKFLEIAKAHEQP